MNTKDILGEKQTLSSIVDRSITSFEDDDLVSLRDYALYTCDKLETVNLPNVDRIGTYALSGCTNLYRYDGAPSFIDSNAPFSRTALVTFDDSNISPYLYLSSYNTSFIGHAKAIYGARTGSSKTTIQINNVNPYVGTIELIIETPDMYYIQGSFLGTSNFYSVVALIIRSPGVVELRAPVGTGTPLTTGVGYIYVDDDYVDAYKEDSVWSRFADQIVGISEYPKRLQNETITDDWETIKANELNGAYKTRYSVGDVKYAFVDGTPLKMVIVGFDCDEEETGAIAPISWLSQNALYNTNYISIPTNNNISDREYWANNYVDWTGWETSYPRYFLRNSVFNNIDAKDYIVPVRKQHFGVNGHYGEVNKTDQTTIDNLWIPSAKELNVSNMGTTASTGYELEKGITYPLFAGVGRGGRCAARIDVDEVNDIINAADSSKYSRIYTGQLTRSVDSAFISHDPEYVFAYMCSISSGNSSSNVYYPDGINWQAFYASRAAFRIGFCT